jgi:hypothetical protein
VHAGRSAREALNPGVVELAVPVEDQHVLGELRSDVLPGFAETLVRPVFLCQHVIRLDPDPL